METKKSIQEQENKAYTTLKEAIVKGVFPPGYRLVERDLAERFSMSRTPVRWALKRLETEGYLEKNSARGVCLKMLSMDETVELLFVRESLEGMACRLAALHRTAGQEKQLKAVVAEMERVIKTNDYLSYYHLSGELHRLILDASQNQNLIKLATQVNSQVARFQYKNLLLVGRIHQSVVEHKQIVEAVCAGDGDMAEKAIREHIKVVRDLIIEEAGKQQFMAY